LSIISIGRGGEVEEMTRGFTRKEKEEAVKGGPRRDQFDRQAGTRHPSVLQSMALLLEASCRTCRAGGISKHKDSPRESDQEAMMRLELRGC
jgi:hypothetical protein